MQDFFDVVDQAVELPLDVDLATAPQRETIQFFLCPDIAENRLHYPKPFAVNFTSLQRIDLLLHLIGQTADWFAVEVTNLPLL